MTDNQIPIGPILGTAVGLAAIGATVGIAKRLLPKEDKKLIKKTINLKWR